MTQQQGPRIQPSLAPGNLEVNLRDLKPGDRISTFTGGIVEVVLNPRDGLWVLVRYVEAPADEPEKAGQEEMLYCDSVGAWVSRAGA